MLIRLRNKFPETKIYISSLLPRKESYLNKLIKDFNDFLQGICSTAYNLKFVRNMNIRRDMLVDNKHINDEGFFALLSNIRYKMFDKTPFLIKRQHSWRI